ILESARATVLAAGLAMGSAHYHQVLPPPGRYPDPALMAYHRRALALAGQLGLKRVTTHPGWMFGSAMPEFTGEAARAFHARTLSLTQLNQVAFEAYGGETAVWRDSVDLYQRLCEWAATAGLAITLETAISEWYGLTLHPDRLLEFHAAVRAPNLRFCLDAGHCHLNGLDVAAVARACAPALLETHFHDNHGTRDEHLPLGAGTIDWPRVAQTLRATRYDGLITFEHPDPRRSAPPWRAACARGRPQPLKEAGA
ncbi:MAG: sugar phosphate isomerase/epimerase, partial [Candidatus Marinimicrobia bacterium]|nr:sugar phosphate isomerase/epimerase [Candidatus Neomarinimicrobiota bacterium]